VGEPTGDASGTGGVTPLGHSRKPFLEKPLGLPKRHLPCGLSERFARKAGPCIRQPVADAAGLTDRVPLSFPVTLSVTAPADERWVTARRHWTFHGQASRRGPEVWGAAGLTDRGAAGEAASDG
jgi:hypothetical protein